MLGYNESDGELIVGPAQRMTCIFYIQDGKVHLERTTQNFPVSEFNTVISLLKGDLAVEERRIKFSSVL